MLEKSLIKLIRSLEYKKFRKLNNLFVAEGPKVVGDMMRRFTPHRILATADWQRPKECGIDITEISKDELSKISFLQHPQQVVGLFPLPQRECTDRLNPHEQLIIALGGIQDAGNHGTIIRVADRFGIDNIVCSNETTDAFSPKVVQATAGSLARVNITYTDLDRLVGQYEKTANVYGTVLDGENIYTKRLEKNGFIIMGNEGNGISKSLRGRLTEKLLIPCFKNGDTAESLNVAVATAITISEFMRQ